MSIKIITDYTYKNAEHIMGYWAISYRQYIGNIWRRKKMREGNGVELSGYYGSHT